MLNKTSVLLKCNILWRCSTKHPRLWHPVVALKWGLIERGLMKRNATWLAMSLEDPLDRRSKITTTQLLSVDHRFDDSQLFGDREEAPPRRWSNQMEMKNSRWFDVIFPKGAGACGYQLKFGWIYLYLEFHLASVRGNGIYALLIALAFRCDTWCEVRRDVRLSVVTKLTQRHEATRMSGTRQSASSLMSSSSSSSSSS